MIYLEMYGRLGNQFFRYAAARAVQIKYYPDEPIVMNFSQIEQAAEEDASFRNVLDDFNVVDYKKYIGAGGKPLFEKTSIRQKMVCIPYYLGLRKFQPEQMNEVVSYERKWLNRLNPQGIYWFRRGGWKIQKSGCADKFLSGCFENPIYFDAIRETLLREFKPKHNLLSKNEELFGMINSTESVCLSVRRGDFESNADVGRLQSICHRDYFEKAIERIRGMVSKPVFFMFSDDIGWVRDNIKTGCETYYEDGMDPVWEKVRLMSACRHFIISNSTFSWWVQYLSTNEEKIVVSPSRWFNNDYDSPLIDRNRWELIEV